MKHYEELATYEREGYEIIVDKTWEDMDPKDSFDDECWNMKQMYADIESGKLDWFMLRVRVLVEGLELDSEYLGGCLYEDARECLTDGTAEDLITQSMANAKQQVYRLYKKFQDLSWELDAQGVDR
jgi:hypothetical protein